ncbi:hypothetical protein [Legionella genomosp. 1]|uniref:hypothetical protein n=1 Tax=Legionella genomosp. 1 TaxID=1093625 RepID=UPI00105412E3|nr:hypothetical protein [Legionella genomosp. 1]
MRLTPLHEYHILMAMIEFAKQCCSPEEITSLIDKSEIKNMLLLMQNSEKHNELFKSQTVRTKRILFALLYQIFQISPEILDFGSFFTDKNLEKVLKGKSTKESTKESTELIQKYVNTRLGEATGINHSQTSEPSSPRGQFTSPFTLYNSCPKSPPLSQRTGPNSEKNGIELLSRKGFTTIEDFFEGLFSIDKKKTAEFILNLARRKDKVFTQAFEIFQHAEGQTRQISEILADQLSDDEMLTVYKHLLRYEELMTWCRGNNLLIQLLQLRLGKEEHAGFKQFILEQTSTLTSFFRNLNINEKTYSVGRADFQATPGAIESLQQQFKIVMENILSPARFPPVVQKFLKLAYFDLRQKDSDLGNSQRIFLAFILLRFINPVIFREKMSTDNSSLKIYLSILYNAIQSISSPSSDKEPIQGERNVQIEVFDPVTRDENYRQMIYQQIFTGLQLETAAQTQELLTNPAEQAGTENHSLEVLGKLVDDFFGLKLKENGHIEPRSEGRRKAQSIFKALPAILPEDSSTAPTSTM